MSGRRPTFAVFLVIALSAPMAGAAGPSLEPLRFMVGAWSSEGLVIEYWMPPLRGLMLGINRAAEGTGMPFFEFLRIEARDDGIYYVASPRGERTTDFKLTGVSEAEAVFENPEHDFPQKIIYRRMGDDLEAEVGAFRDGEWSSFKLRWSAQPCAPAD